MQTPSTYDYNKVITDEINCSFDENIIIDATDPNKNAIHTDPVKPTHHKPRQQSAPQDIEYRNLFLHKCSEPSIYPIEKNGQFYKPTALEVIREVLYKCNVFRDKKNWLSAFFFLCLIQYLIYIPTYLATLITWKSLFIALIVASYESHMWEVLHHRGFTHRAYKFKNKFALFFLKNFHTNTYPEEIYDFSHQAHHLFSDQTADPYTPRRGLFYLFWTHITEQPIRKNLSEKDYEKIRNRIAQYTFYTNNYKQYQKWGTVTHPLYCISVIYMQYQIKIIPLYYFFGAEVALGYTTGKTFQVFCVSFVNYFLHGYGKDQRRPGEEFAPCWSINGWVSKLTVGQWHSNHHLYPRSARTGFLRGQIDIPFLIIKFWEKLGLVYDVKDNTKEYMKHHYLPYQEEVNNKHPRQAWST